MSRVRIIGARGGREWPLVLQTAAESREAGRPLVLYVPLLRIPGHLPRGRKEAPGKGRGCDLSADRVEKHVA